MSRVAIIGSCITRDLWPIRSENGAPLLYLSRTSLPSLFAPAVRGVTPFETPPAGLTRYQHEAVLSDLTKSGLAALLAFRPTHLIFDFIDERFDLLKAGDALATHSWELDQTGYLSQDGLARAHVVPRLSEGCEQLWRGAVEEMVAFVAGTPLRDALVVLHAAQWADRWRDAEGGIRAMDHDLYIWDGRPADLAAHNALLRRYQSRFTTAFPQAAVVSAGAERQVADAGHRWGLSPFHYVEDYYAEIWRQLATLGV